MLSSVRWPVILLSVMAFVQVRSDKNGTVIVKQEEETGTPATIVLTPSPSPVTIASQSTTTEELSTSSTTLKPTTEVIPTTTARRSPCKCLEGSCLCCTGYLLNRLNVTTRNRACLKVEYEPDEFEFNIKLLFNDRKLYQNKISGKNPQPICLPIRRIININACIKFSNVYMIGRNLHACLDFQGDWNDFELFSVSFECFRIGMDGVAIVKPEEGGGLPVPTRKPTVQGSLDYDDSAKSASQLNSESNLVLVDYDDIRTTASPHLNNSALEPQDYNNTRKSV